jgi:hypothetical protein
MAVKMGDGGSVMKATGDSKRVDIWIRVSTEDQLKDESPETHEHLPSDDAATKLIWLALRNITADWGRAAKDWKAAMNQFYPLRRAIHQRRSRPQGIGGCTMSTWLNRGASGGLAGAPKMKKNQPTATSRNRPAHRNSDTPPQPA